MFEIDRNRGAGGRNKYGEYTTVAYNKQGQAVSSTDYMVNTAIAKKGDMEIKLCIDSDVMIKNGEQKKSDTPARLIDDAYTFVPLRAVSEAFGCRVEWTEELKRVDILTAK